MENKQQKLTSKKVNKPWYEVWWRAILAVLFFPFVGVYLTWTKTDWNKFVKIGITIVCAIILMTGGWAMFLIFPLIPFLIIYLIKIKLEATWIKSGLIFLAVSFGSFTILWMIAYAITKDTPSIIIPEESKHDILDVNGSGVRSNSKVRIYLNDREVSEVSANEDGKFSTDIELKEGDNEIYAAVRYDKKTKESSKKIVKYISPAMIKKAEEEKQKAEKEKRQAEEKKQNEEKQRAEEEKKKIEETKKAEEKKRKEKEVKKAEEEKIAGSEALKKNLEKAIGKNKEITKLEIINERVNVFYTVNTLDKLVIQANVCDVLKSIQKNNNVNHIHIKVFSNYVDIYGNKHVGKSMQIDVDRDVIDKINFDNFVWQHLPQVIGDGYWEHYDLK